jgi:6-phosphogluconolactonase
MIPHLFAPAAPAMSPPSQRIVVESAEDLAATAASWLARGLASAAASSGGASLALSGGSTPAPVYRRLATLPGIPWERIEIFFGDERAVPPDHPSSNYRMASETLLSVVPIPREHIHRMEAEQPDLDLAARSYEAQLPPALDLLILGLGSDGHTASLFPHAPALAETGRRVVRVTGGEPLVQRLTVTPPVIGAAKLLLMLAAGAEKAEAVALALEGPYNPPAVPAQLARRGTWVVDRAAAALLAGDRT